MKKIMKDEYYPNPALIKNKIPKGSIVDVIGEPVEGGFVAVRYKNVNYMIPEEYLQDFIDIGKEKENITTEEMAYCFNMLTIGSYKTLQRYGNTYISGTRYRKAIDEYITILNNEDTKTYGNVEESIHKELEKRISKVLGFDVKIRKHSIESGYFIEKK